MPTRPRKGRPRGGRPVTSVITVEGTSANILAGQTIWIVVAPAGASYLYPQTGPAVVQDNGRWLSTNVRLGGGRDFDILAVLADKQGASEFQHYLTAGGNRGVPH